MKNYVINLELFNAIISALIIIVIADNKFKESNLSAVSDSVHHFSNNIYKVLANEQSKNFVCSPIGLNVLLSMLYFGAGGTTKKQLKSSLNLFYDENVTKKGYQKLIDTLNNVSGAELRLANKLFSAKEYELLPEFTEITKTYFRSESEYIDFKNQTKAAGIINNWCANQTNNRITEILKAEDLEDAQLVLVNTVYFKSMWKNIFDCSSRQTFHISETKFLSVEMMHVRDKFYWGSVPELDAIFIKLPYKSSISNEDFSMYIILPNEVNGLKNIESKFANFDFSHLRGNNTKIDLYMPKFKIESSLNLKQTLIKMGISKIFERSANFTDININEKVHVSKILQKVFIEVNEKGSEGTVVTTGNVRRSKAAWEYPAVKVNRPFIYSIIHESTKTVLFQGHIYNPLL